MLNINTLFSEASDGAMELIQDRSIMTGTPENIDRPRAVSQVFFVAKDPATCNGVSDFEPPFLAPRSKNQGAKTQNVSDTNPKSPVHHDVDDVALDMA